MSNQQPPPFPTEPPPIIVPKTPIIAPGSARYTRRRGRGPERVAAITGIVIIVALVLVWYFGPHVGLDLFGSGKRAIKTLLAEELGSNPWNIKKWGKSYSTENCMIWDEDDRKWYQVKEGIAYPYQIEISMPLFGWIPKDRIAIVKSGKVIATVDREVWELPGVRDARRRLFAVVENDPSLSAFERSRNLTSARIIAGSLQTGDLSAISKKFKLWEEREDYSNPVMKAYWELHAATKDARNDEFWDLDY